MAACLDSSGPPRLLISDGMVFVLVGSVFLLQAVGACCSFPDMSSFPEFHLLFIKLSFSSCGLVLYKAS